MAGFGGLGEVLEGCETSTASCTALARPPKKNFGLLAIMKLLFDAGKVIERILSKLIRLILFPDEVMTNSSVSFTEAIAPVTVPSLDWIVSISVGSIDKILACPNSMSILCFLKEI